MPAPFTRRAAGHSRSALSAAGRSASAPIEPSSQASKSGPAAARACDRGTVEMNMNKIESVDVDQTLLGRLFNYGNVTIRAREAVSSRST